jgi:molybdenum cofactor cytidylyltransferase
MSTEETGVVILAAGSSSRMGMSKQMLPLDGTSLLGKTIATALETNLTNIVVVLGSNADEHRIAANEFPVTTIENPAWQKGMGTSIRTGVNHFQNENAITRILILVCDQPTLTAEILLNLIRKHEETSAHVTACRYANTVGVPALFTKTMFEKLSSLQDDQGAKKIILQHKSEVATIDFPGGEIDLDTRDDYDNFIKNYKS